jgi:signal transduction histidine kinase
MEIEKFDFREVILHKLDVFEKNAADKGVLLINNITGLCNVMADKNMIDLVVRNLTANAIKFCNKNDTVTITSEIINGKLQVCIKDTGRGIEKKNIPKLFGNEMFSTYGTANEKGSGLGLMLCKDFVEKNNGKIWVESEFGVGSKFCFTIPLA